MSAPKLRILCVDADATSRDHLTELLAELGHEPVAAASAAAAVMLAADQQPDAVLVDVGSADEAGLATAIELARALPDASLVLLCGDPACRLREESLQATGAAACLPRPVAPGVLDATVRLALAQGRALAAARQEATEQRRQLEERKLIERAKGVLMRRTGASEQEAYAIMRRSSQDRSRPMTDIARAILESEPGVAAVRRG